MRYPAPSTPSLLPSCDQERNCRVVAICEVPTPVQFYTLSSACTILRRVLKVFARLFPVPSSRRAVPLAPASRAGPFFVLRNRRVQGPYDVRNRTQETLGYEGEFEVENYCDISLARRRFPLEKRLNVVGEFFRLSAYLTAIIN
jgi:hypothetical protein